MADRPLTSSRRRAFLVAAGVALLSTRAAPLAMVDRAHALGYGQLLLPGDLVFRSGLSVESSAVLAARPRSRFSHVGVVADTHDGLRVVHALPPEGSFTGGVIASTWREFAVASDVRAVAVFRVRGVSARERVGIAAAALRQLGEPFNSELDLDPGHGVYCTQVALAALTHFDPTVAAFVRPTQLALLSQPVYLPDSLLDWPRLVQISQ